MAQETQGERDVAAQAEPVSEQDGTITVADLVEELQRLYAQTEITAADQLTLLANDTVRADRHIVTTIGNLINEVQRMQRILAGIAGQDPEAEELADIDPEAMADAFAEAMQLQSLVGAVNHLRQKVASEKLIVVPGQSIPTGEEG